MSRIWDAVVVGAGPAGCEFAFQIAQAGYQVLLLERREIGREKPCGGGIQPGELLDFGYPPDEVIERRIKKARIQARDGGIEVALGEALTVSRSHYDSWLCERAQAAGAQVKEASWVVGLEPERYGVKVIARQGDGFIAYGARILVHAGGFPCHPLDHKSSNSQGLKIRIWRSPDSIGLDLNQRNFIPRRSSSTSTRSSCLKAIYGYSRSGRCSP